MYPNPHQHDTCNHCFISYTLFLTRGVGSVIQSKVFQHSVFLKILAVCLPYQHEWGGEVDRGRAERVEVWGIYLNYAQDLLFTPILLLGSHGPFHRCPIPKPTSSGETPKSLVSRWEGMEFESSDWEKGVKYCSGPFESKSLKFIALLKIMCLVFKVYFPPPLKF